MNFLWYYRRLQSMSLPESIWRLRRFLWQARSRLFRTYDQKRFDRRSSDSGRIVSMIAGRSFYGLSSIDPLTVPETFRSDTVQEADRLLQHRWNCLSLRDLDLGNPVRWNRECKRGWDLPLDYAPWMDYRNTQRYGQFKYFWELGRFGHLITLSKAYYLTKDERYAREVIDQIHGFVDQCPYLLGVHWTMAMETGLRLLALCWIVALLKEYLDRYPIACRDIEWILMSHAYFTVNNYSRYSSANNHLIGEVAGVFVASLCFGQLPGMTQYCQQAHAMLEEQIRRQFYPCGVNKEQSSHYHISCYNTFLLAGLLARQNGLDFSKEYWTLLEKGAEYIAALSTRDLTIPQIGDSDDGKSIELSQNYNQVGSLLATASVIFNRSDLKQKVSKFDEMSYWLLGPEGQHSFDSLSYSGIRKTTHAFREGGYYLVETEGVQKVKVLIDAGPLGYGSLAGHGHADALSILLWIDEMEFLIDPGTYIYEHDNIYRDYFRSTRAHNTIQIDDQDQSQIAGPFLWSTKADTYVESYLDKPDGFVLAAWHDGYRRFEDPVIHRRVVQVNKLSSLCDITDQIEAQESHTVALHYHFAPECQIRQVNDSSWTVSRGPIDLSIRLDPRLSTTLHRGQEHPILGWASRHYDRKEPSYSLRCEYQTTGRCEFHTQLYPSIQQPK